MITAFKDFKRKEAYFKLIEDVIMSKLRDDIYKPLFDILDIKLKASNDIDILNEALNNGTIYYADGAFYAKKKFNNEISRELEKIGAVYDRHKKIWRLPQDKLPDGLKVSIANNKRIVNEQLKAIDTFLQEVQGNIDLIIDDMVFTDKVITVLDDAGNEIKKNVKGLNVIVPELTKQQKEEIAASYTNNIKDYMIKDFAEERIPEMRQKVQELVLSGARRDVVEEMLLKNYGIDERKAKFLARNETCIMLAEYKKVTYQEMGADGFIWNTIIDGRERELHKQLNGTKWTFNNLPIIDERTGQRGLPGETYNCYHKDTEVLTKNGFKFIKDVKVGELIATLNPDTMQEEFAKCTGTINKKVDNLLYFFDDEGFELKVDKTHPFFMIDEENNPVFIKDWHNTFGNSFLTRDKKYINKFYVTQEKYNDYVYDIEVEKNHTLLIKYGKSIHFGSNCRCTMTPYRTGSPFNAQAKTNTKAGYNKYLKDNVK